MTKSKDPDETARYEPSHLALTVSNGIWVRL